MDGRVFVRLYTDAVKSGLLADMGPERWHTLTALAAFMDRDGVCYPSQDLLASIMGVSRQTAVFRIKSLCDYRWNGKPIVTRTRVRDAQTKRWSRTVYRISKDGPFSIFDREPSAE